MAYDGESGNYTEGGGDDIVSHLPDLAGMSLDEVLTSIDPLIIAAGERVVRQVLATRPTDGHC